MRQVQFFIFFSIVLTVYGLINWYIFSRGLMSFEPGTGLRRVFILAFWFLVISYPLGRILEKIYLSHLSDLITWAGAFWLAAMVYLLMAVIAFDLLRMVNHFTPFFDKIIPQALLDRPYFFTIGIATTVFLLVFAGHLNALLPRTEQLTINLNKKLPQMDQIRIAMVSDIHLGTVISTKRLSSIIEHLNSVEPDVIMIPGDLVDEDLDPVIRQNLGALFGKLNAPLGVYASTGNHEYIGGADAAVDYLSKHDIIVLRDTTVEIIPGLWVIGRNDIESDRFAGEKRKSLAEITKNIPSGDVRIVLDHQPRAYKEAQEQNTDLILSGHTHHGQLWPFNYITQSMFPLSWGYKQFGQMHAYVSSGIGTWGPPVRIGNRPEVVVITLNAKVKN
ncbi:MAG: metallophosphoesterase [Bacteroidales bacterium]|jgi:predicted MPP superfamily phosphohydrolase|nr:metallophosphoesterase [Bacteroidales bacterium]HOI32351.1 metallophosphoesterase [Bacteroidales bacterium]